MAGLTYFTVTADMLAVIGASGNPSTVPIRGKVTFTPMIKSGDAVLATTLSPRPGLVSPQPVTGVIGSDGQLGFGGSVGVRLIADTSVLGLTSPLFYEVDFSGLTVNGVATQLTGFNFQAAQSDITLSLATVARVPGQLASGIVNTLVPDHVRLNESDQVVFSANGIDIPYPLTFDLLKHLPAGSYSTAIGDGAATSIVVTHNLGSRDVGVTVYDAATFVEVNCDKTHTTSDTVTLGFALAPATDSLIAVVAGESVRAAIETVAGLVTVLRYPPGVAGGFVGDNGYGTDILWDANGEIIQDTLDRWYARLQTLGLTPSMISGWYGGGFVGDNGHSTELAFDNQGKVYDWVLQQWANRWPAPTNDPATIVLPSTLYMVAGQTYRLEYAKIIADFDRTTDVVVTGPATETGNFGTYWEYTPSGAETFTLTVTVKDRTAATRATASRPVVVLAAPSATGLRHLAIGDSITRNGEYVRTAAQTALAGHSVGIRTYDNGVLNVEGRTGWSVPKYSVFIGLTTDSDSPFLFPTTISGANYLGNTEFWRQVVAGSPTANFDGFQKIAKGWGSSFLFDSTGYPVSPVNGNVVIDPTKTAGSQFLQYNGSAWVTMSPQPSTGLDFSKYIARYSTAFAGGNPTSISIMLGSNDFFTAIDDTAFAAFTTGMDAIIAAIRAWSATVPITLVGPPSPGPDQYWAGTDVGNTVNRADFQRRIIDCSRRLYAYYDTAGQRTNKVHVVSFLGTNSDANTPNFIHPGTAGHQQMGPWLAGMLAHLINTGEI